jgi:hypothetical protein
MIGWHHQIKSLPKNNKCAGILGTAEQKSPNWNPA